MSSNSLLSIEHVERLLRYNPLTPELTEKGGRPFLDENKAAHRAKLVVEVATKLRLDWKIQGVPLTNGLWIPIYEIPGSQFGKSDEDDVEECFRAHGVGLNWGGLHRFARACEVGFRLFPKTFPRSFTKKIKECLRSHCYSGRNLLVRRLA